MSFAAGSIKNQTDPLGTSILYRYQNAILTAFAIILGFLVEQKMRQERETFQKIAQVTTLKRLRNVSNIEGRADPGVFLQEIFFQLYGVAALG